MGYSHDLYFLLVQPNLSIDLLPSLESNLTNKVVSNYVSLLTNDNLTFKNINFLNNLLYNNLLIVYDHQVNPSRVHHFVSQDEEILSYPKEFQNLERRMRFLKKQYAHLDIDDIYEEMFSLSSKGMEIALDLAEKADNMPTNYSNILNKDGMLIDVTKLDSGEIIYLNSTLEDLSEFNSLEHIKTLYLGTAPNVKLYYPEPFIASPSFVHNDIGYIHILQYQF
jgi:hypothetical protein